MTGEEEKLKRAEDEFRRYLNSLSDGTMDVNGLLSTEYGEELLRRLRIRTSLEQNPEKAQKYYAVLGLTCEFHDPEDYFGRYKLFIPINPGENERFPILFWNHGGDNSIEAEEFMTGYLEVAGKERFILALAQNTNQEKLLEILDYATEKYPVDTGRVYVAGFSQGSQQAVTFFTHHPERVTAAALTGTDIWRPWDNFDNMFTEKELEKLEELTVPLCLQVGTCEPFAYAPLNLWHPNHFHDLPEEEKGHPDDFVHPGKITANDPTRITDPTKGRLDPQHPNLPRMSSKHTPQDGEDIPAWSVGCVNKRMELLKCEKRDVDRCVSYLEHPEDELHHVCGIYADREEIRSIMGVKHYICEIDNRNGINAFRYVVTENSAHWPAVTCAAIGWNFVSRFHRTEDGVLVQDVMKKP